MYTLNSPISDRFGTALKGNFKCAYKNERLMLIAAMLPFAALIVLFVISLLDFVGVFDNKGAIKGGLADIVYKDGKEQIVASQGVAKAASGILTLEFAGVIACVLIAALIILLIVLHNGRNFRFEANQNGMTVYYPNGKVDAFKLEDVITVRYKERKALLGTRGYNITVVTKKRDYDYRLIHTHLSRSEGIAGTPFNIPKEYSEHSGEKDNSQLF